MQRESWHCTGNLIPKDDNLTLTKAPFAADFFECTTEIKDSEVRVSLDVSAANEDFDNHRWCATVRSIAQYIADLYLSILSFGEGGRYSTLITMIEDHSTGDTYEYSPILKNPSSNDDLKIDNIGSLLFPLRELAAANRHFRRAMRDYANALHESPDSLFYCYRALETLRESFEDDWDKMHQELGTNQCAIYVIIQRHSNKIRHGSLPNYEQSLERLNILFYALEYVRDTLLAFLIRETPSINQQSPVLDCSRIPEFVDIEDRKKCTCRA